MTLDYALLHRPTDSLVLPTKRRFFPFKIPNFHRQLRHYISTADPDRIYVVAHKVVHSIHISSQKWDTVARVPFEPRCLAAGYGWIAVGGSDNGECAFIRLPNQTPSAPHTLSSLHQADVDSALPIDLDSATRASPPGTSTEQPRSSSSPGRRQVPEVEIKKFGGLIVNSVTIHRLPADGERVGHEDVVVVSNNDKTVKVYSLTRSKILEVLQHPASMNYAIISPDSSVLAAVGDANVAYFYGIKRDNSVAIEYGDGGDRLTGWKWPLLRRLKLQLSTGFDDGSCFTVAFSPSGHLCAVGSQAGIITILDVEMIRQSTRDEEKDQDPKLYMFRSSRPDSDVGAVRSMAFAPEPWDLLVWVEDTGRAGIADIRQAFSRRQILSLDTDDPQLHKVQMSFSTLSGGSRSELEDPATTGDDTSSVQPTTLDVLDRSSANQHLLHDSLVQDLTDRERQIIEFLNTRWTSRQEEGTDDDLPRATLHLRPGANRSPLGSADVPNRSTRATSPYRSSDALHELFHENHLGRVNSSERSLNPRRQGSVVLSQPNTGPHSQSPDRSNSGTTDVHILLRWTASPSDMQSSEDPSRANDPGTAPENDVDASEVGPESRQLALSRASALWDTSFPSAQVTSSESRQRSQRSRSIPRRSERPVGTTESRYDAQRVTNSELRANVAAERLRRQRLVANEVIRQRRWIELNEDQLMFYNQVRSPRWIRSVLNDFPDRNRAPEDPGGTAGIGWGADGRSLYIGTVEGIFEYQINLQDRKTFPVLACR